MLTKRYSVLLALLIIFFGNSNSNAQCTTPSSSNGWTVTFNISPIAVVPEFTSCPTYYHYEIRYNYTVTFTGSTSNRSVSANIYFTCTGGSGGLIYQSLGTFTGNASGTFTTSNYSRQYNSPYSTGNPGCSAVTLTDVNCTSVRIDYWGNGLANGSLNCALSIAPAPIELLDFNAKADQNKVNLEWTTATESNNDYFTVEKSQDGINFKDAFRVKGAGSSTNTIKYAETDENPYSGISYYRLKQTDYNGDYTYSKMVFVQTGENTIVTNVYPNPATGSSVNVYISSASASPVDIDIFNPLGQRVSHLQSQPNENGIIDMPVALPEEGSLFFMSFSQDHKITGHHKICVTKN